MKDKNQKEYDVGVIIGRFQVHELHEGHVEILDHVKNAIHVPSPKSSTMKEQNE